MAVSASYRELPGVSNGIRFDSLLVRALAAELDATLGNARVRGLGLDGRRRRAWLQLEGDGVGFHLHPTRGWIGREAAPPLPRLVRIRGRIRQVASPPDERLIRMRIVTGSGELVQVVIELLTNQWNLLLVDSEEVVREALWPRTAGGRRLVPGSRYAFPPTPDREGADGPLCLERWFELLRDVQPAHRASLLVRHVAYTSPLNAVSILREAGTGEHTPTAGEDPEALLGAYERYRSFLVDPAAAFLCSISGKRQPYPFQLGAGCDPAPSLLVAFARAAAADEEPPTEAAAAGVRPDVLLRIHRREARLARRLDRLQAQLEGAAAEAELLRRQGTLLLSRLGEVRKGPAEIELRDFDGSTLVVPLDPALAPAENARRLFDAARRKERALRTVPTLIARVRAERERWRELRERAERGETPPELQEASAAPARTAAAADPSPFRRYRTSSGLEVRVGRSAKGNDELTFHNSSPDDIWLHARDFAGAHVVLRWSAEGNPPPQDLREAAVLAALHSRARTSGVVPVDWTRRKYVRKPRKSPPGVVTLTREKTLFVEPEPGLERRLRWNA